MGLTAKELKQKMGRLPPGFKADVVSAAGDYLGEVKGYSEDWQVTISGFYGGRIHYEMFYLPASHVSFITSVRDKLMASHWRRVKDSVATDTERQNWHRRLRPFSQMEELNHAEHGARVGYA